jgi:uncharacterized protein YwqG
MGFLDRFRSSGPRDEPRRSAAAFERLRVAALEGADLDTQRGLLVDGFRAHGVDPATIASARGRATDGIALFEREAGRSRIGGPGLLPAGVEWPIGPDGHPLSFIAAFALQDLPALDPLPDSGTLLVYWSERYFEWPRMDFRLATRVFWVDGSAVPAAQPEGLRQYVPVPLHGARMPIVGELDLIAVTDGFEDAFFEAWDELVELHHHQLLGTSRDVQGPVLNEIGYWFDQGEPRTRADYSDAELAGDGWRLLGQIDSTDDLLFGDAGALYLVIPEADLMDRRLDRVMGIMQCA